MSPRPARGFTLIEMVIAFAILSISLMALFSAFESSLARLQHDTRLSEATLLAKSLLSRAGTEWPLGAGSQAGDWQGFAYKVSDEPVGASQGHSAYTVPTTKITAGVTWHEYSGDRTITLSTLKFAPKATR